MPFLLPLGHTGRIRQWETHPDLNRRVGFEPFPLPAVVVNDRAADRKPEPAPLLFGELSFKLNICAHLADLRCAQATATIKHPQFQE